MKLLLVFLLSLGIKDIFATDFGSLYINLYTYDLNGAFSTITNAHFMVIDPFNRMAGQNPFTNEIKGEIPNSGYSIESLGELKEGGDSAIEEDILLGPKMVSFEMGSIEVIGIYNIQIFGVYETKYSLEIKVNDRTHRLTSLSFDGYLSSGGIRSINISLDPTPGAPPPTITKIVSFQTLRDDFNVAQKLNQIGDDKFVNSLIKMVGIAEKLYNRCENIKSKGKDENKQDKHKRLCYRPVIMILELIKKRLEIVNKICDNPNECKSKCKPKDECDEEKVFEKFKKENIKEEGIKEFFSEWDKDEWHKHKKMCKRFVTDEALKIISEDIDWLIKSIDVEKDKPGK